MSNRIQKLFKNKKDILSVYFTAGYPQLHDTAIIIKNLEKAGVDLIEIGMPFSDPLADGPVIQESSRIAIENGMTLKLLFEQLETIREEVKIPLVLMGYLNPILQYGETAFTAKCAALGIDGLILPDMPLDYYRAGFKTLCEKHALANILLITPETTESRIKLLDENSSGFVYMVSSNSITGSNTGFGKQQAYFERIQNMQLKNPTLLGFGIHDKETYQKACEVSNGAIVGSAFIKHLTAHGSGSKAVQQFVDAIKG